MGGLWSMCMVLMRIGRKSLFGVAYSMSYLSGQSLPVFGVTLTSSDICMIRRGGELHQVAWPSFFISLMSMP